MKCSRRARKQWRSDPMFFLVFMKKYKELEKSTRGPLDPLKIILENEMSLNRARRKGLGSALGPMKNYSGRYCTVLYCTVVLYKYHAVVPVLLLQHRDDPDD